MLSLRRALQDEKLGLYFVVFLANMGYGVMSPVLATIQTEYAVSISQVALANSAFGIARLLFDVPIGMVMDRIDRRWMQLLGAVLLAGGMALSAAAPDFGTLLLGRALNGAGAAIVQVTCVVWLSQLSSDDRRGRSLGIYQAVFQLGTSVSPIFGGVLADWFSWRASFMATAAVSLLAVLPMFQTQKTVAAAAVGAARKPAAPVEPVPEPRDRRAMWSAIVVANIVSFVLFFSVGGYQNTVVPLYGSKVLGLEAGAIGLAIGITTMLRFVMSLVGGELSDRLGRRAVLVPGLVLMAIGTLMFQVTHDLGMYWLANVVLSIGRFGNNVPATVLADHVAAARWSFQMGLNRMIGDLGIVLGPAAMGLLIESTGYSSTTFISASIVAVSALIVVFGVSETRTYQPVSVPIRRWFQIDRRSGE